MTDSFTQQLTAELGARAATMPTDPSLAGRVIHQGHVVRRRRRVGGAVLTGVAAVAVVLVAAVPALRPGLGATPAPAHHGLRSDPSAAPASGPVRIGYAVNHTIPARGSSGTVVMPSASGAKTVSLPTGWTVSRVARAGSGLVVGGFVAVSHSADEAPGSAFMAYLSPDGQVHKLRNLHIAAEPTTPDGLTWATVSLTQGADQPRYQVDFVRVDTDTVVEHPSVVPSELLMGLSGAVGPRSLLVRDSKADYLVWSSTDGLTPRGSLPGDTPLWNLTDARLDGSVLLFNPEGLLRLTRAQRDPAHPGRIVWTVAAEGSAGQPAQAELSPRSTVVAVNETGGVSFLDAANGALLAREGTGNAIRPAVEHLAWEDDRTLLVERGSGAGTFLERCAALSGRCVPVDVLPGDLVLAES